MTAIDRVDQVVNSDELRSFNVQVSHDPVTMESHACVNLSVKFNLDETELDRLTDYGLNGNIKQKLRIAMRSMQVKLNEDLRRLK